ncbi:hypothetical protein F5144DRAFT_584636 [Chaetomium tenue]|uniref:Uncharacterized protein n=1 Tax=Chaetomium tenue TaxID=1854479 RepID=A0ACB7P1W8_9PEZI|nr:hypothetical protein F5144DRAFT_584636 [Chaetomium globosum]
MMEPPRLPPELLEMVINHVRDGVGGVKMLCRLSLLSRQWYAIVSGRIYSTWLYDGEQHSISSLWKFLRTVLTNKRIADGVHELNIQDWPLGLVHDRGRLALSDDDFDLIRDAIRRTGLGRLEDSALEALRKADPRPLMALLLASLPNLTTLYAHLPATDIFFAEILQKAIEGRQDQQASNNNPLSSLRQAHLASAWNYQNDTDNHTLALNHLWPVFLLPSIQELSVFDLALDPAFDPSGSLRRLRHSPRSSNITNLTLVHKSGILLPVPEVLTLLALPKRLVKLSFYLNDCDPHGYRDQPSNVDLWNGIRQHENSLEHLDFYRDCNGDSLEQHSRGNSYFGSMRGFTRLRHLCIQPEVLLGGCCKSELAPFQLKDTLPPNLESLTLYGYEGLYFNRTLAGQLEDIVASTDFPSLRHVALEDTPRRRDWHDSTRPTAPLPHHRVKLACKQVGKTYETKYPLSCIKGGIGLPYYRHVTSKRGKMGKRMRRVRYALQNYLRRMFEARSADGSSTSRYVYQSSFSLDDLDNYELPWDKLCPKDLPRYDDEQSDWEDERQIAMAESHYDSFPDGWGDEEVNDHASDLEYLDSLQTDPEDWEASGFHIPDTSS